MPVRLVSPQGDMYEFDDGDPQIKDAMAAGWVSNAPPSPDANSVIQADDPMHRAAQAASMVLVNQGDTLKRLPGEMLKTAMGPAPTNEQVMGELGDAAKSMNPLNIISPKLREADPVTGERDIAGGLGETGMNVAQFLLLRKLLKPTGARVLPGKQGLAPAATKLQSAIKPLAGEAVTQDDLANALQSVRKFSGPSQMPVNAQQLASRLRTVAGNVSRPSYRDSLLRVANSVERSASDISGGMGPHVPYAHTYNWINAILSAGPKISQSMKIRAASRLATGQAPLSLSIGSGAARTGVAAVPINAQEDQGYHRNKVY